MAVHPFFPGTETILLLIITTGICLAGLFALLRHWGLGNRMYFLSAWRKEAFREGFIVFCKTLVCDVFLFRRVWNRSKYRWISHMCMFWGFLILGGLIIISLAGMILVAFDPTGPGKSLATYVSGIHLPYDIPGYVILAAALFAISRRLVLKTVRNRSSTGDFYISLSVFIIIITGIIAEWFSGYATFIGKALLNWDMALQVMFLHIYAAFLLFVMLIPWTRFRHIITAPLILLARRGGE